MSTTKRGRKRKLEADMDKLQYLNSSEGSKDSSTDEIAAACNETSTQECSNTLFQADTSIKEILIGQALNLVPNTFKGKRIAYIKNILNQLDGCETMTGDEVCALVFKVESDEKFKYHVGTPPTDLLWKATIATKIPHMQFLGPPTSTCYNCCIPLQSHNAPSIVLCFGLQGPLPGLKITLRCTQCHINYRYVIEILIVVRTLKIKTFSLSLSLTHSGVPRGRGNRGKLPWAPHKRGPNYNDIHALS